MSSLSVFVILTIHSVYLYDPIKPSPNLPIKVDAIQPLTRSHVLASISPFERDIYIKYHKDLVMKLDYEEIMVYSMILNV